MVGHVITDHFRYLLIKAAQENGAHHDCCVHTNGMQETSTLQSHVGCTHNKRLARGGLQRKDVVTGDGMLLCSRNVRVGGAPPNCHHELVSCDLGFFALLVSEVELIGAQELSIRIEVLDLLTHQLRTIPKVERLDMHL